jgi:predicted ATPase
MIRHVTVQGYKSLKDVDLDLAPFTVIFGPNAAGKSNLFDALALLSRIATQRTLAGAFEDHRGAPIEAFYHGDRGLEGLFAEQTARFKICVDVAISGSVAAAVNSRIGDLLREHPDEAGDEKARPMAVPCTMRYEVIVEMSTESGRLRVSSESLAELDSIRGSLLTEIDDDASGWKIWSDGSSGRPWLTAIGQDHSVVSEPVDAYPNPYVMALREELSRWRFYYLDPKRLMRTTGSLQEAMWLDPAGSNLAAFYNTLKSTNRQQFDATNRLIPSLLPPVTNIDVERTKDGELRLVVYESGIPFPASVVSDGTLRVLGLLGIINSPTPATVVGYEEPENGVHPRRLQLIARILAGAAEQSGSQFLVNTHSDDFPQYCADTLRDALIVNCRRDGASTRFDPVTADSGPTVPQADDDSDTIDMTSSLGYRIRRGDFGG